MYNLHTYIAIKECSTQDTRNNAQFFKHKINKIYKVKHDIMILTQWNMMASIESSWGIKQSHVYTSCKQSSGRQMKLI